MTAVIRDGYLWTCHHVGLDGTDGDYDGGTPDRSGIQWLRLGVAQGGLSYGTHGRIYDSAGSSPYSYYFPSLNVDDDGNVVYGFSGSKSGEHVGAFFTGRKANGAFMSRPVLLEAGRVATTSDRWGDYSATIIDPTNDSFWTVQEYAFDDVEMSQLVWATGIMQIEVAP